MHRKEEREKSKPACDSRKVHMRIADFLSLFKSNFPSSQILARDKAIFFDWPCTSVMRVASLKRMTTSRLGASMVPCKLVMLALAKPRTSTSWNIGSMHFFTCSTTRVTILSHSGDGVNRLIILAVSASQSLPVRVADAALSSSWKSTSSTWIGLGSRGLRQTAELYVSTGVASRTCFSSPMLANSAALSVTTTVVESSVRW
mmetsp:Transcript_7207/g.18033  ORF Transcript_7207/g.18033 Transcript_7207/m.18033 type:complete len:202 (-) Transcript_7207:342-947(-)